MPKDKRREKLAKIVMSWLKTAKPDNADAPSDLVDDIMDWAKKYYEKVC